MRRFFLDLPPAVYTFYAMPHKPVPALHPQIAHALVTGLREV
jgi:hypothetical protein